MNTYTAAYLALRALYVVLYIRTTSLKVSALRSLVWFVGTASLFSLYFKAAAKLVAES